jgi:glycosyltransferase involved in cell wall biosynthesis
LGQVVQRLRVNFISNLNLNEKSGGWTGVNAQLFQRLSRHFDTNYVGPISPRSDYPSKIVSKLNRVTGHPGTFHFFSERRLKRIAKEVSDRVSDDAAYDFFHGQTPWILFNTPRPYGAYVDACFSTYIDIYHARSQFLDRDIERICRTEAEWLKRATHVFFQSQWALDETVSAYNLPTANLSVVGVGGNIPIPVTDSYTGGMIFLFIALDFERKGGRICCEAFRQVKHEYPGAELVLLGERPPNDMLAIPGVTYGGYLRKTVPSELERFQSLLSSALALIHPTTMDTMGMVLIEAGYHGCPSIAPRSFGIPELIKDGITGFLVEPPLTPDVFAERMLTLLSDSHRYGEMRRAAKEVTSDAFSWESVIGRITRNISAVTN